MKTTLDTLSLTQPELTSGQLDQATGALISTLIRFLTGPLPRFFD